MYLQTGISKWFQKPHSMSCPTIQCHAQQQRPSPMPQHKNILNEKKFLQTKTWK